MLCAPNNVKYKMAEIDSDAKFCWRKINEFV